MLGVSSNFACILTWHRSGALKASPDSLRLSLPTDIQHVSLSTSSLSPSMRHAEMNSRSPPVNATKQRIFTNISHFLRSSTTPVRDADHLYQLPPPVIRRNVTSTASASIISAQEAPTVPPRPATSYISSLDPHGHMSESSYFPEAHVYLQDSPDSLLPPRPPPRHRIPLDTKHGSALANPRQSTSAEIPHADQPPLRPPSLGQLTPLLARPDPQTCLTVHQSLNL
jgi:hypothetical protein